MTRVRAVRKYNEGFMTSEALAESFTGTPFAAWEWPTDAPPPFDKPEAAQREWHLCVLDTCVRIVGTPKIRAGHWMAPAIWQFGEGFVRLSDLRPVEEPKPCEHALRYEAGGYIVCPKCGAEIGDRRTEQRRQVKRRAKDENHHQLGRRQWGAHGYSGRGGNDARRLRRRGFDRRSGKERRKS